ncbi:MAG: sigma-70 family RNA polymerase sigma factor [Clostridium sp.]
MARHYSGRGHELEDLFQIGCIGLLKAVDKFDLGFQVRFSTYAVPMIAGEIRRFLRDDGMIRVSRSTEGAGTSRPQGEGNADGKVRAGTWTCGNCEGAGYQL